MRTRLLLATVGLLAGCEVQPPQNVIHRTGSNYSDRLRAFDQCDFAAIQAIPRAMATEVSGGYYNPGTIQCNSIGTMTNCNRVGAVNIPASSSTYDANAEIRTRYINRCLEDKGYNVLPRPQCKTDAERAAMRAILDNQPPASAITCALPRAG